MNDLILTNQTLIMSSREMSELTKTRHDSVKRTIQSLIDKGLLPQTQIVDGIKSANGVVEKEYNSDKRDSLIIVARLSPEFTAAVIDRWQELESKQAPKLPISYKEALLALIAKEEALEEAIKTKAYISRKQLQQ